ASLSSAVDRLLEVYQEAIAASAPAEEGGALLRSAGGYLARVSGILKARQDADCRRQQAEAQAAMLRVRLEQEEEEVRAAGKQLASLRAENEAARKTLCQAADAESAALRAELQEAARRVQAAEADAATLRSQAE